LGERLPQGPFELALVVHDPPDPPKQQRQEAEEDHGEDHIAPLGPGAGSVVENGGHRFTARRLLSQLRNRPVGKVSTTKPKAKSPPMRSVCGSFSIISFIRSAASATPMVAATVVFLVRAISTLASGPMTERNACGSTTSRSTWLKFSPSARAASACPTGTVLMPERIASHTKAAV